MTFIPVIQLLTAFCLAQTPEPERDSLRYAVIPVAFMDQELTLSTEETKRIVKKAQDYFNRQFRDSKCFAFDIMPTVTLSKQTQYYGENTPSRRDARLDEAVIEVVESYKNVIDLNAYDNDKDNEIDNLILLFAGESESDGGSDKLIWPQHFRMSDWNRNESISGKKINNVSACIESGKAVLICHEFGHFLGLPDLYDTDMEGSGGLYNKYQYWSLMAMGGMQNDRMDVPDLNAMEMHILGIGKPDTLKVGDYRLKPATEDQSYILYETGNKGELFLFENRNGLNIYHLDRSEGPAGYSDYYRQELSAAKRWQYNQINANPEHPCAVPVILGLPQAGMDSFMSDTEPAFKDWSGRPCGLAITRISKSSDGAVTFNVREPLVGDEDICYQTSAIIRWTDAGGHPCTILMDNSIIAEGVLPYTSNNDSYSYRIDGLEPATEYNITIQSSGGYSINKTIKTRAIHPNSYPFISFHNVQRNDDGSFINGCKISLQVINALDSMKIEWFMDGKPIQAESDGFYTLTRSGTLKARIWLKDGSITTVIKEIKVRP